eukprot:4844739-Pleurochrysis_carterae.AAC.1
MLPSSLLHRTVRICPSSLAEPHGSGGIGVERRARLQCQPRAPASLGARMAATAGAVCPVDNYECQPRVR